MVFSEAQLKILAQTKSPHISKLARLIENQADSPHSNHLDSLAEIVVELAQEIGELKQSNQALEEQVRINRLLAANFPGGIFVVDRQMRYLFVDGLALEQVGLSKELIEGKTLYEVFPQETVALVEPIYQTTFNGQIAEQEVPFGGRIYWNYSIPIRDETGEIFAALLIAQNITERVQMEEALRKSEESFKNAFEYSPIGMALVSPEGKWLKVNRSVTDFLGYNEEELLAIDFQTITYPDDLGKDLELVHQVLRGEIDTYTMEKRYFHKSGEIVWALLGVSLVRDAHQQPLYFVSQIEDITQRKQAEEALRESKRRYDDLVSQIPGVVYRFRTRPDGTSVFDYMSPRCWELNGIAADVVMQNPQLLDDQLHPDDAESYWKAGQKAIQNLEPYYWEGRVIVNSQVRWRHLEARPHVEDNGDIIWNGIQIDTTSQQQAEEALRESEERYRLISELSSDYALMYTVLPDGSVRREWITDAFKTITGFTVEELDALGGWMNLVHPDDFAWVQERVAILSERETDLEIEYRIITKSGEVRNMLRYGRSVFDPKVGRVTRIYAVIKDITERKRLEEISRKQEHLEISLQKESELSQLKSKIMTRISHEFRTPLAIINISSDLLGEHFERLSPEKRERHFQRIKESIQHITQLLDDMSNIVQNQADNLQSAPSVFNLETTCIQIVERARASSAARHDISLSMDGNLRQVKGSPRKLEAILSNLISNAAKYSPDGTDIQIQVFSENNHAVLKVSDQGIGIPEADLPYIYEPLYRGGNFDEIGGLGLGMTMVKNAVESHGGTITIETELGKGTTFTVRLPIVAQDSP